MADEWNELDEALGISPSASPHLSPLSDHSSGFSYEVPSFPDRDGSPQALRRPSKKRRPSLPNQQRQQEHQQKTNKQEQETVAVCKPAADPNARVNPLGCPTPNAVAIAEPAPSPLVPPADGTCALQALPLQLLLRLLSFLSAQDLSTAAQVSLLLRSVADEAVLWRRLFCARWGKPRGPQQLPPRTWKARYVERDLMELQEARARDASTLFLDAQVAKRQTALGRAHVDDPMEVPDDVARKVDAWRVERGFAPLTPGAQAPGQQQQQKQQTQQQQHEGQQAAEQGERQNALAAVATRPGMTEAGDAVADGLPPVAAGTVAAAAGVDQGSIAACVRETVQDSKHRAGNLSSSIKATLTASPGVVRVAASGPPHGTQQRQQQQRQQQQQQQQRGLTIDHRWCRVSGTPNVYCSEATGDVHICDQTCTEVVLERSSGLLVCPISGTVRHDLGIQEVEGEEEEEGVPAEEGDFGGRLARAFEAGYHAESLEELERTCFVPRRR